MKKTIYLACFFCLISAQSLFGQQFTDAKMNEFMLMDTGENGLYEVFVNPMHFNCACEGAINILFASKVPNKYISKDENISIVVSGKKATVTVKDPTECCILKAGIYTVD
jgi:hypothetical protein